ncbi:MAG: hypothetical protein AAGI01_03430, partial [Myxococcota bacterium]
MMYRTAFLFFAALAALALSGCFLNPIDEPEEPFCLAVPSCEGDEVEVDTCPADASCVEREQCGVSILCQEQLFQCLAFPVCERDEIQVDACDLSDA